MYLLGIDEDALGSYNSSEAAADDVYTQTTGFSSWDALPNISGPTDLGEWTRKH
jgi:hypothetical protein